MPDYQFWHLVGHNSKLSGLFSCTQEPLFKAHNGLHCVTLDFYLLSIDFTEWAKDSKLELDIYFPKRPQKGTHSSSFYARMDICVLVPVN